MLTQLIHAVAPAQYSHINLQKPRLLRYNVLMTDKSRNPLAPTYIRVTISSDPFCCFYCGDIASTIDHVPPLTRVDDYKAYKLLHEMYIKVPACNECNRMLGSSLQESIELRIEHAKDLLSRRHSNLLRNLWTQQRLDDEEMTGSLRSHLLKASRSQQRLVDRLNFYAGLKAYRDWLLITY